MKRYMMIPIMIGLMVVVSAIAFGATVSMQAPDIQVMLLKYSPFPAGPGNYVTLTFEIENDGNGDADNIRLKILPYYPFSLDRNPSVNILNSATPTPLDSDMVASVGKLPASQYTLVEYKLLVAADVLEGNQQIEMWYQTKENEIWLSKKFEILVQGTDRLEISDVVPYTLSPGRPTDVVFVLNNSGTAFMHDIAFTWSEKNGKIMPLGSGNRKYIESIGAGGSAEVPFTLAADPTSTSGVYTLNVNLTYSIGTNLSKSLAVTVGMFVGGQGDFDVNVQDSQSGSVSLSIANIGANPATSVSIKIPEQQNFVVTGQSSSFVGDLNPGDFTLASFQITARNRNMTFRTGAPNATSGGPPGGAPGNISGGMQGGFQVSNSLKVEISYTDTNGNRQIVAKDVPMISTLATGSAGSIGRQSGSQSNIFSSSGLTYIIIGIIGVVIIIVLLKYGKRIGRAFKREKKENTQNK